jgi:hypothetical protein
VFVRGGQCRLCAAGRVVVLVAATACWLAGCGWLAAGLLAGRGGGYILRRPRCACVAGGACCWIQVCHAWVAGSGLGCMLLAAGVLTIEDIGFLLLAGFRPL